MNGVIKVSTAKLTSTANEFSTIATSIKSLTSQMTQDVNALSGSVWSGDAATAYKSKFNGLQDDINRMVGMINEHSTDLKAMAKAYEDAETSSQNVASGLQTDIIS